jgi:hypothetical protein
MVHTIYIFLLYVGITTAIQEHVYDHCHRKVSGACLHISKPIWVTLKSFASIEYEFGVLTEERGRLQKWFGKVSKWFTISRMVPEGFETLPVIYRRCWNEIRSNRNIYARSRIFRKVKPRRWTTMGPGPHGAHPWHMLKGICFDRNL